MYIYNASAVSMSIFIVPINYRYLRYDEKKQDEPRGEPAAAAPEPQIDLPRYKNFNEAELKEYQQFTAIWEEINGFLDAHHEALTECPYKRCNVRFVADTIAEPLIRKLHEKQIPYLVGRDPIDVELFYYYIIGSGRQFYDQTIQNSNHARHVWENRLFEPPAV